ncbi:uncharacterized protein LOC129760181 [Uranotaenia lowii]|uniref:uncharacterized protein LOC129760181 n=1 Tax=Uranotaenia lowii TaxID=190385 RepID=UPI00247ADA06|nr:uncharacterized protein LOC129760181 [Uranotaenia lowii]
MSVPQRFRVVKMKRLCLNCLGSGHFIDRCTKGSCRECNKKHHSMLHNNFSSQSSVSQNQSTVNSHSYRNNNRPGPSGQGREHNVNPQAQHSSTNSYPVIQTHIRHTQPQHTTDNSFTFNAAPMPECAKFRSLQVLMSTAVVRVEDRFGNHTKVSLNRCEIPQNLVLADPEFWSPGPIDMIIGAEYFCDLLRSGKLKVSDNGPTLQETEFGWVVSGRVSDSSVATLESPVSSDCFVSSTANLEDMIAKFWELESCNTNSILSVEESVCEQMFKETTIRNSEGKFVVTLPKKRGVLRNLVLKPESTTTKLRVVFDASCRTSTGVSLNDALMVGPTVQNDLLSIILRFRLHRYAISADIEKMYRMVQVQQPDQHLQRILWRDTPDEPVKTFELTTVTYGTASAPYLATRCLKQLAEDGSASHPIGSRVVRDSFYVDDCLVGADSVEEGKHLVEETTDLTNSAGFNLRKFNSNSPEILASIPEDLKDKKSVLEFDSSDSTVKTLGLKWDTESDNFCFSIPHWRSSSSQITKRSVHSDAACLFDPLGLVGPVVVQAKMIIQQLWRLKVGWDDPLDEQYQNLWKEYKQSLMPLESLSVPRWLGFSKDCVSVQLHGFCDASEVAYGACLYLRCVTVDGQISVRLVTAKSRVAPLENLKRSKRKTSIPRLELSSALQLSHLYEKFARVFPEVTEAYFWTDSMIVKHWLASHPSRWQMFVANRVSEIQHITRNGFWNHVAGIVNPADLISRGVSPARLCYERLWFEGPQWLSQAQQYWPRQTAEGQEEFDPLIIEERPTTTTLMSKSEPFHEIFGLKSSFTSLIRIVAVMLRFRHNAQKVNRLCRRVGPLTPQEMQFAIVVLVRLSQNESFESEFKDLEKNGQVERRSRIAKLNPFVEDGTIRIGGRLSNAPLPDSRKHPWVLDHRHPLALLIMREYHLHQFHAGQQLLIASVRRSFWPTNINSLARKVIHECVPCFKSRPKISEQIMSDLPSVRVTPSSAFLKVGVDYCGPFNVSYPNRRATPVKCYVAIFVCLAVKAVHLELVMDLTTEAFVAALRRFIGRRSKPELITYVRQCDDICWGKQLIERDWSAYEV